MCASQFTSSLGIFPKPYRTSIGVSVIPLISQLANYYSLGVAMDVGVLYHNADYSFNGMLLLRNVGIGLKPYHRGGSHEVAPLELLLGFSYTLQHAPLRFIFTLQNLETYHARFLSKETPRPWYGDGRAGEEGVSLGARIGYELLSHMIIGVEITPIRYFYLQVGFNAQHYQHMRIPGWGYPTGLSWGLGVNYQRFSFNFAQSFRHVANVTYHVGVHWRFGQEALRSLTIPSNEQMPMP